MRKPFVFCLSFIIILSWFLGFIVSLKYTTVPGFPWFLLYLFATSAFFISWGIAQSYGGRK